MDELVYEYDSSINCLVTNIGLEKSQEAAKNEGWFIYPTVFGVSSSKGELDSGRQSPNYFWYQGKISARKIIDEHTIEFICDIPPTMSKTPMPIREVYLFAEDEKHDQFILCLGQCEIEYDPNISITFRMIINILNIDTVSVFKIVDTCARDIEQHNNDPTSHPDLRKLIESKIDKIVVSSKEEIDASSGDVLCINATEHYVNINMPERPEDGDRITVIDMNQISHYNHIVVHPNGTQKIDLCHADFVLDSPGAWVTFLWNDSLNSWCVDIGGRNIVDKFVSTRTNAIYYTTYFNGEGIYPYKNYLDYEKNSIVIGSDNCLYIATSNNGPSYDNIQDPTLDYSYSWTLFSNKKILQEITDEIKNGTPITVPSYTVGNNQLSVYIQGVKALCGGNYNKHTYREDYSVTSGKRANKIYFYDDIPANFGVTVIRE